ncbi:hypothetical protein WDW37_10050 [Bdellovibrionota bacterium FG-1]
MKFVKTLLAVGLLGLINAGMALADPLTTSQACNTSLGWANVDGQCVCATSGGYKEVNGKCECSLKGYGYTDSKKTSCTRCSDTKPPTKVSVTKSGSYCVAPKKSEF